MSAFEFSRATNILSNAILPFDPRRIKLAMGSAEYIAWEVIVTMLLRQALGYSKKSVLELIQVHAVSLTFMGGAQGFMDAPGPFTTENSATSLFQQLKEGAKGIPAVLLAKYSVDTCYKGFHVPFKGWSMSDVIMSAASKTISRPLFQLIYPYIRGPITEPLEVANEMVRNQVAKSTLNRN